MFTGKAAKHYLDTIISDIDDGKTPKRPRAPKWVRNIAMPAAVGLTIGLTGAAGCVGEDPVDRGEVTREMARDAKADGFTDWLCEILWLPPGCDLCEELGWYDDGICDDFCESPDPDCAPPPDECYTDADCAENESCEGAVNCPEGAYCILPASPGSCEPSETGCMDGADNDLDGLVDCADPDCIPECVAMYMAPPPEPETDCHDGVDNDLDGLTDCDDLDCADQCMVVMYMAPMPNETGDLCDNGIDDDADGMVDCDDPDCLCVVPMYMAPPPVDTEDECWDGIDNDADGMVDCDDPDCDDQCMVVMYMAPMPDSEDICDDGFDNDADGLTDCDDPDCACATPRYMAPPA